MSYSGGTKGMGGRKAFGDADGPHKVYRDSNPAGPNEDLVRVLKDDLLDAVRRGYVGTGPWFVGPPHLGMEVAPESIAIEPQHARAISRIHEAICDVLDEYGIESVPDGGGG